MADTVCIYRRRRPKCLSSALDDEKENDKELNIPLTTVESRIAKSSRATKSQPSWIDRSLSSRSNINKVKVDSLSSKRANEKAKKVMSPNVYRKKRVEAPENFVHEQRSYFEQVDAFELEEESPPSKDRWTPNPQQEDVGAPYVPLHRKGLLQAVQEDTPEELPNDASMRDLCSGKDSLSHILKTPQLLESILKSTTKWDHQISKQGFGEHTGLKTGVSHEAHETHLTGKLSSDVYKDSLRHILKTPQSFGGVPKSVFKQQLHVSKQGLLEKTGVKTRVSHETHKMPPNRKLALNAQTENQLVSEGFVPQSMPHMVQVEVDRKPVCKGLVTSTEPIPIIIISDDENEHPGEILKSQAFSRSKNISLQVRQHEVDRARHRGSYVILDDSPDCKPYSSMTPVKCESHQISPNKVPKGDSAAEISVISLTAGSPAEWRRCVQAVQLYPKADDGLVAESEKLNLQARKELPNLEALLQKCGQTVPLRLEEAIMQLSTVEDVLKLGEGTYGEAFRASNLVFKIVPMGGNFRVNGEVQKSFAEMYTEMLLTLTLNRLRSQSSIEFGSQCNVCNNFVETKMVKVCQGLYGQMLINAWEEWDIKHKSENDHPRVFPEYQLYMLFVLADGGKDLESFPIASFEEARSILTQVTAALAIAEEDCEFEHRDLHWGNILVAQTELSEIHCRLDGTDMHISTCGMFVHIIDFTLSRLYTGKDVLFSNLSDDPLLFEGPKGDIQAETYRKMLHLTGGLWEKRFSKTNCYWIHYLVDILLTKKKYPCSPQESRALRALKKRVLHYESARACLQDDFFVLKKK